VETPSLYSAPDVVLEEFSWQANWVEVRLSCETEEFAALQTWTALLKGEDTHEDVFWRTVCSAMTSTAPMGSLGQSCNH
jgi:hypothetical protein